MDFINIKEDNCKSFEPAIKGGALVLFFSNRCEHCNGMKPKWDKLKERIPELSKTLSGINIVSVDTDRANKLDEKWHKYASSVPTIIAVDSLGNVSDFDRERETDKLENFLKETLSKKKLEGGTRKRTSNKKRKGKSKIHHKRKSHKRKSHKRKSHKRKSHKRKSHKRKSHKRKSHKR